MSWHCDTDLLRRYTAGAADLALAASVEAHLVSCPECRAEIAAFADAAVLDRAWAGVTERLQPTPLRPLRRLGLRDADAVLLAVSQSLRGPWVFAVAAVLLFAMSASVVQSPLGRALYLLVAPLVPVVGVVASFAATDPITELTTTTPYPKARLALLRAVAVSVTTVPVVTVLGAVIPGIGWLSIAWIGPGLGLTLVALVALTWWPPNPVSATVSVAWTAVVLVAYRHDDLTVATRVEAQLVYLLVAALAALALAARIRAAHTPGGYA